MKKIFILNGVGTSGKDSWSSFLNKYIPTYKESIINLPKQVARILGWDGSKTEEDRKFLSDLMDLSSNYNDAPFKYVVSKAMDFKADKIKGEVMVIDMRDPKDIDYAVKAFGAKTILIRNPNVPKIETNHADANVENYKYDYIIENNGSLEQLDTCAKEFVQYVIKDDSKFPIGAHCIFDKNSGSIVFRCNRMLRD